MSKVDSPEDIYGKNIGMQLTEMTKTQKCIAEKLISEVIFYGKLEKLTLSLSISLSGYANSYNYSTPSPSSSIISLHSETSHNSPATTMPIPNYPNNIQRSYDVNEFLLFKNL